MEALCLSCHCSNPRVLVSSFIWHFCFWAAILLGRKFIYMDIPWVICVCFYLVAWLRAVHISLFNTFLVGYICSTTTYMTALLFVVLGYKENSEV
jgi:hypothetical protein